ncbi:MAG: efflux RND transporter periplasmic adaptor subunit [Cytophagaceae bacterium]
MKSIYWLCLFPLMVACGKKSKSIQPTYSEIIESVYASGEVKSKEQYDVYSKTNGLIEKILVTKGQLVKKGDVLIQLENNSVNKNVETAKIQYRNTANEAQDNKRKELQEAVSVSYKKYQTDSLIYFRQKDLWRQGIGTAIDLEQKELMYQQSKSNWISSKARLSDFNEQLDYQRTLLKNNVELTETLQNDYLIRSVVDGRVYDVIKKKGEWVSPNIPVAVLGNAGQYVMELEVDEKDIVKIKTGQKVVVRLDSYQDSVFTAHVTSVDPIMNVKTRTFTVTAVFENQPSVLYPYLTVEANIIIESKAKALVVPVAYLTADNEVVLEDGTKDKVTTGLKNYQWVEILSGVDTTAKIILPVR